MSILLWSVIFIVSLFALVKGADWLIISAEKIGYSFGLSPFIVGVTIVGMGTSFPELFSSLAATLKGVTDVAVANSVGSNIANILLVVGFSAVFARQLIIKKNLIDLDLPLLAIGTGILLVVLWDKQVTLGESILMLVTYGIYLLYTLLHKEPISLDDDEDDENIQTKENTKIIKDKVARPKLVFKDFLLLVIGILGLVFGAKYLIESLIVLSEIFNISTGLIAITAVAVGTSLPELLVSIKAAIQKKSEVALGNIFGSNLFNALVVVGFSGLFRPLTVDNQTYLIGLPIMALATILFIFSGISRRIHIWEGAFYLSLYILFIAKLFNFF